MNIGSELKAARVSRKITLETVSQRTKIPVKYLEALEENRYDIFPSHTYAKGFIRAYAKVVGVDPIILTRQFNAEIQPVEVRIEPKNAEAELEKNLGWRPTLDRPPVFRRQDTEENPLNLEMLDEGYAEPIRHEPSVMRQRAFNLRRGKWGAWAGRAVLGLAAAVLLGTLMFYGVRLVSKIKWGGSKSTTTATETSAYQPIVVGDKYQHLILKGLDKSWVLVTMDDGQTSSEVDLDQGETKTYKALKSFKLKLGNAGGVQVQFNGKPLGILGTTGQVVEIQLPPGPDDSNGGT
jgi:cytoskeleton protein RodZ